MNRFQLSCESTADLPFSYMIKRNISVLSYSYTVDDTEYPDGMGRDPNALPQFYAMLKQGKLPATSQINETKYKEYFASLLPQGDVLHISFGSGMTPSVIRARSAAEELQKEFPEQRVIIVDSLCSSSGYGLLVDGAADLRDNGASMEEIRAWAESVRLKIHHCFFSTDMKYFRRSGRVSGMTATVATVLNICPLMRLNREGKIVSYGKVRGKQAAIRATVDSVKQHAENGKNYSKKLFIAHSDCLPLAKETAKALKKELPHLKNGIQIFDIGTVIASHAGPGTVAVFFWGDEREND